MLHDKPFQLSWAISPDSDPETYFCLWLNTQETANLSFQRAIYKGELHQAGRERALCLPLQHGWQSTQIVYPSAWWGSRTTPAGQVFNQPASWTTSTLWYSCFIPWDPREGGKRTYFHPHSQDRKHRSSTESRGINAEQKKCGSQGGGLEWVRGQERRADGKRRKGGRGTLGTYNMGL